MTTSEIVIETLSVVFTIDVVVLVVGVLLMIVGDWLNRRGR